MKLTEAIRDWLGINRYCIRWEFPSRVEPAYRHRGSTEGDPRTGNLTKGTAKRVAKNMNATWGAKTHWIERESRTGADK